MEKIKKYLSRVTRTDRRKIRATIRKIINGDIDDLDIKQLRGYKNIFRVKLGQHRIIYRKSFKTIELLFVGRRDEKTYKSF